MNDFKRNIKSYGNRKVKKKLRIGRLFLFLFFFVLIGYGFFLFVSLINDTFFTDEKGTSITKPQSINMSNEALKDTINVIVLGLDGNSLETTRRSDSMLLLSFDTVDKKVTAVSIPRDTRVKIGSKQEFEKINSAYAYGGIDLCKQTVADFLKIPIHYYVALDVTAFIRLVDVLGGIDVYVENDMKYEDPYQNLLIDLKKGYQTLNGEHSIHYVRYRSDELGDIGRLLRQQKFLESFVRKVFSFSSATKIMYLKPVLENAIETDIPFSSTIKMLRSFKQYNRDGIDFVILKGHFENINSVSYWLTNEKDIQEQLKNLGIIEEENKNNKQEVK